MMHDQFQRYNEIESPPQVLEYILTIKYQAELSFIFLEFLRLEFCRVWLNFALSFIVCSNE